MSLLRQEESIWELRYAYRSMKNEDFKTQAADDVQNRLMASLVPDEIIYNSADFTPKSYEGSLMFAALSGFTELFESYKKRGIGGSLKLTQLLNKYIGGMVREIISHNGDVLKFSGDELMAIWKTTETQTMVDVVHSAINCALIIQKYFHSDETDVDVNLEVKLAISAGTIEYSVIGDEYSSDYVVVGEPVWNLKFAGCISKPGDIILSPTACLYTNQDEYTVEKLFTGGYMKLIQQQQQQETEEQIINSECDSLTTKSNEFSLRPSVEMAVDSNILEHLEKFIIKPLRQTIKIDEPLDNLTEIREVVVIYINVVYKTSESQRIIELANETYKLVSGAVEEGPGCLIKVSLFKLNMEVCVIFGLRGFKHEMECQFALEYAAKCHQSLYSLKPVKLVSIGIASGEIYCGLCGDMLRREYTVIGSTVNRASRLMMFNTNKVICDRETFLNSEMEAASFILQETNEVSQIRPIYEFCGEITSPCTEIQTIKPFSLLGNQSELTLFQQLLKNFLQLSENSHEQFMKMLVIQGGPKQGKTRVLQEFVYLTPEEIPIFKFTLSENDNQIPFQTLKSILYSPLDLSPDSNQKDKNYKLMETFEAFLTPELHYFVNDVFGMHLKEPTNWLLNMQLKPMRFMAECNFLRKVCLTIFKTKSLIVIDNFEHIDKETWEYFDVLLDSPNIAILASIGYGKSMNTNINTIFSDKRVKVALLKAVDRWFQGALACQFLNVYAIPSELENAIQVKSNGNPGWIKHFLSSLLHSGCIVIKKGNVKKIHDVGLICPPLYMLKRLSPREKDEWQQVMEEKRASFDSDETNDDWRKYIDICRDTNTDVVIREQLQVKLKCPKVVPVCVFSSGSDFNEIVHDVSELSMDNVIIRTFDALSPNDQLVLKCSASLGDQFFRDMLLYVLEIGSPREAALSIKKLFEFKILACAEGDFIDGTNIVTYHEFMSPENYKRLTCKCYKMIDETFVDLPEYASCRHIQFCNTRAREIASNLLTDEQQNGFHSRAIEFLEKQPRKCRTCRFDEILATTTDYNSLVQQANEYRTFILSTAENLINQQTSRRYALTTITVPLIPPESSSSINFDRRLFDRDCTCLPILTTTYSQLIAHCKSVGERSKLIDVMLQYAEIAIRSSNLQLALTILNEALDVLNITPQTDLPCKSNLIRGRIYSLLGNAFIELEQFDEAEIHLQLALEQYNCKFPYNQLSNKFKTLKLRLKQYFGLLVLPNSLIKKNLDHWESFAYNNLSEILSHMATIFMKKNQWMYADLAATWSLSKALKASNDYKILCTAYSNMLMVASHYKRTKISVALEGYALELCNKEMRHMGQEEQKAATKLCTSVFWTALLLQADIVKAKQIGYMALRSAISLKAPQLVLPILPTLIHCCLLTKDVDGAVQILNELRSFADNTYDQSGRVWFFSQCIAFHLETGFFIIPYDECEKFAEEMACEDFINIKDKEARNYYFVTMWLWCVRNHIWDKATLLYSKIKQFNQSDVNNGVVNQLTGLYLLEGLITTYVYKIDSAGIQSCFEIKKEIKKLMTALEGSAKYIEIILPRLYHMKAYYHLVHHNDVKGFKYLKKANKLADKYHNILEKEWTMHSLEAWKKTMEASTMEFWRKHCDNQNQLDYRLIKRNNGKFGFFTLPLPINVGNGT